MPEQRTTWSLPPGSGDRWVAEYEAGRPGWPAGVVDLVRVPSTATVLDLAAGTGKVTRLLLPAFRRVIVVEPQVSMWRVLRVRCPGAEIVEAAAADIPIRDRSVDAIFVGEAFHHLGDQRSVAELSRILRPGGTLVMLFNVPAGPWEPSVAAAERLLNSRLPEGEEFQYDPLDLNHRRVASGAWREAFAGSPFGKLHHRELANPQTVDREGLVAFYASMGWILELPDAQRVPLVDEVRSLLDAESYRRDWTSQMYWTSLPRD